MLKHMEKIDISSLSLKELEAFFIQLGEKPFRSRQVYSWLHQKLAATFEEMTDISKKLKEDLNNSCALAVLKPLEIQSSALDGTKKYLFALGDGNVIESVFMQYRHGNSVCISSQAGCRMGCRFCASALHGFGRNLTPGEMLNQVYRIQADTGQRVSHIVVMGTGEPLDNYGNLLKFIRLVTDEHGLHISQRNITVSTCGLIPAMHRLAEEELQITLALSLHASNQEKRRELMPVSEKYEIHEVINACRYYFKKTGRRITFEYSLMAGVNDSKEEAKELSALIRKGNSQGMMSHVNLIPVNPVKECGFLAPEVKVVQNFKNELEKYGINVTIRREMGRDIEGACGQLRKHYCY